MRVHCDALSLQVITACAEVVFAPARPAISICPSPTFDGTRPMTSRPALQYFRSPQHVRGWAMACAALVLGASTGMAQPPPSPRAAAGAEAAAPILKKAEIDAL